MPLRMCLGVGAVHRILAVREEGRHAEADDAGLGADAVIPRALFVLGAGEELQALFIDQLGLGRDGVVPRPGSSSAAAWHASANARAMQR